MTSRPFVELDYCQIFKEGEHIGGDVFLQERRKDPHRIVSTLSDGLGSGVKANVLASLTANMAQKFTLAEQDIRLSAEIIMNTLPVCRERKISYATFTMTDMDHTGRVRIIEYDNPPCILIRGGKTVEIPVREIRLRRERAFREEILRYSEIHMQPQDRLIFFSDGLSQSGMGTAAYPLGWRWKTICRTAEQILLQNPEISARDLSSDLARRALRNDGYAARDDITCAVTYLRTPRKTLVVTGPPIEKEADREIAGICNSFDGKKVICGGTTATILSREFDTPITIDLSDRNRIVPPCSHMQGFDLVTEGMLTLSKTAEYLQQRDTHRTTAENAARRLAHLMVHSDEIHFLVGTKINEAHQDPNIPMEMGIRRTLIRRIQSILEKQYLKETVIRFI
ncbi:MAG: SpoIIE family protein phosphatase [Fibrobacterota bacterium]